jgi:hypothetical protein
MIAHVLASFTHCPAAFRTSPARRKLRSIQSRRSASVGGRGNGGFGQSPLKPWCLNISSPVGIGSPQMAHFGCSFICVSVLTRHSSGRLTPPLNFALEHRPQEGVISFFLKPKSVALNVSFMNGRKVCYLQSSEARRRITSYTYNTLQSFAESDH